MNVSAEYLATLFQRMEQKSIVEIMRDDEIGRGFTPVVPGQVSWLSAEDWPHHVVITTDGTIVRIVALIANRPGNGAFRRLVERIQARGLVPVVVAPSTRMRSILKRWHWRCKHTGTGLDAEEQWRPRKGDARP